MPNPSETASNVAKAVKEAKELGLDPIVTTVVMAATAIMGFLSWLAGERGGRKLAESETDITAALIKHDEQKAIAQLAADMNKAVSILVDQTKILSAMDRGQRETHVLLESIFTALQLSPLPNHRRRGEDPGERD